MKRKDDGQFPRPPRKRSKPSVALANSQNISESDTPQTPTVPPLIRGRPIILPGRGGRGHQNMFRAFRRGMHLPGRVGYPGRTVRIGGVTRGRGRGRIGRGRGSPMHMFRMMFRGGAMRGRGSMNRGGERNSRPNRPLSGYMGYQEEKKREDTKEAKFQKEREERLGVTWKLVSKVLTKLEKFIQVMKTDESMTSDGEKEKNSPWDVSEQSQAVTEIYDLCTLPECNFYEKKLYEKYSDYLTEYLSSRILTEAKARGTEGLLSHITKIWLAYKNIFVKFCSKLFGYLDRFYVKTEIKLSTTNKGYQLYRDIVFQELKEELKDIVLKSINRDREKFLDIENSCFIGEVDRDLVKEGITMFMDMGLGDSSEIYEMGIEKNVIDDTFKFYQKLSERWINTMTAVEYVKKVEKKITEEISRLNSLFTFSSKQKLINVCYNQLLKKRQNRVLHDENFGIVQLMKNEKFEDISRLVRLMEKVENGLEPIAQLFQSYVVCLGKDLFEKHEANCVELKSYNRVVKILVERYTLELIEFHRYCSTVVEKSFAQRIQFTRALSAAFNEITRFPQTLTLSQSNKVSSSQIFAYYLDDMIRKHGKDVDFEERVDSVIEFIQFFEDKDLFMETYRNQFSKRLLVFGYNEETEKNVITKFKLSKTTINDVYRLEKMLKDKNVGSELSLKFKEEFLVQNPKEKAKMSFDFSINLLTMNIWPTFPKERFIIHADFLPGKTVFEKFFRVIHSNKVLNWVYGRSTVQLQGLFRNGTKLFDISTFQGSILLLFNEQKSYVIEKIERALGLDSRELMKLLVSLCNSKNKILTGKKKLKKKWYKSSFTELVVNEEFSSKFVKIKCNIPRINEKEAIVTKERVSQDRLVLMDACLVRIMKLRKRMTIKALINEAITQLTSRFLPTHSILKRRIENLIDREFLERDQEEASVVLYSA